MMVELSSSRGKWITCGPLTKLLQVNSCGSSFGGMSNTAVRLFRPMVIIHSSGTTMTAQMNSATTYQDVVPTRRGFFFAGGVVGSVPAVSAVAVLASRTVSVGSVVTVRPERGELRGQGDHGDDDDEQHPHLCGRVPELRDPAQAGEAVVVDGQHQHVGAEPWPAVGQDLRLVER